MRLDAANQERPGMGFSAGDAAAEKLPDGAQPSVADDLRAQLELLQRQLKASQVPPASCFQTTAAPVVWQEGLPH